jgi:hypothetical protein
MKPYITTAIQKTLTEDCKDPVKVKGKCMMVSFQLFNNLVELGNLKPYEQVKILHAKNPKPHFWVWVEGYHIDLTAKQFEESEECPKIWINDTRKDLYEVRKGKGEVLFRLKKMGKNKNILSKIKSFFF